MLRRRGVLKDNLDLSTDLIMKIDHSKEFLKLSSRALALFRASRGIVGCVSVAVFSLVKG